MLATAAALLLWGSAAHACATCGFNDESSSYFLKMIIVMTSLPLICVGGTVLYLKRSRRHDPDGQ